MENKEFSSVFQRIYDEKIQGNNIMVILCGSLISMMYSEVLAYDSPLYGRRTAQIKLQTIKFQYFKEFFKNKSHKELIEFYSITGGIPKYILEFDREQTPLWNIENNVFDKDNFLYSEPKFLLQEKINDLSRYFSILHAISSGNTKLSSICSQLGISSGGITPYITKLIDLDIVEKEVPVTENIDNGKKGLYKIKDNYLSFWFSYVYPYQSYLEIENITYPLEKIKSEFDLWISKIYESLARESVLLNSSVPFPVKKLGRWWDKEEEIDIVGIGENEILFSECKWSNKKVGLSVLYDLKEKSKVEKYRKKRIFYSVFKRGIYT